MAAWNQPIASAVSIIMIGGMCATVLLTTGRTVGAEEEVLGSLDSAGTRSIIVRADAVAGLDASVLDRVSKLEGVAWSGGFGPATDVQNAHIDDGTKVPLRLAYGGDVPGAALEATAQQAGRTAIGSASALQQLGLSQGVGGVVNPRSGENYATTGVLQVPDYLQFLEPLLIAPQLPDRSPAGAAEPGPLSVLVVIAARPDLVSPVSQAVLSVLAVDDPTKVQVTTSEDLATLRSLIEGQLGSFGRNLVLVIFALSALLVAAMLYGLVMLRRKDFGRRRALGASKQLIVGLLLTQMSVLGGIGAVIGCVGAAIGLVSTGDPLPPMRFFIAVGVLAMCTGTGAALLPAVAAARRDPLKELRVP